MTKKYLILTLFLALVTSNIFFYSKLSSQKNFIEQKTHKFNDAGILLGIISSNYNTSKYYEQHPLDANEKLITSDGDSVLFENIVKGPKLIIRNSQQGCGACLESELLILKKYISSIGYENVLIINSNSNLRRLNLFKTQLELDVNVFNNTNASIQLDFTNKLYCFVADSGLTVMDLHVPEKTYPQMSDDYYNMIIKKYFD